MDISKLEEMTYDELRVLYKQYLHSFNISKATINTASVDTFYLWRKDSKTLFWDTVLSNDFENEAMSRLLKTLSEHSSGNVKALVGGYLSHLRKFRFYINLDSNWEQSKSNKVLIEKNKNLRKTNNYSTIPSPTVEQVELYLTKWEGLENYHLQEDALNKLFLELSPNNADILDILLKAATLNDFYSTNILSIYPVAKHILSLNIDERLDAGDVTLVRDIQHVTISNKKKSFYSFATKYCSHHNPLDFPIYDSYVDEVLRFFRYRDNFSNFKNDDLKDYVKFKEILVDFRGFYDLDKYNLKQIDQYVWQLGKAYFPKNYGKKKRGDKLK